MSTPEAARRNDNGRCLAGFTDDEGDDVYDDSDRTPAESVA